MAYRISIATRVNCPVRKGLPPNFNQQPREKEERFNCKSNYDQYARYYGTPTLPPNW
ncbi:hypothetical protein MSKU15_2805 [Komagataeibacter diospyri]|nr:hypothetical protein MSKU15_2805 [Komagataeibacter diospyri]